MASEAPYPHLQANKYRPGRIDRVRWAVTHCTAGPENKKGTGAEAVQKMFAHNTRDASAHVTVDNNSIVRSVHDWDTAYACKSFNASGLHVEIVGLPGQSRKEWLDDVSLPSLKNAATVIGEWSARYNIVAQYAGLAALKANDATHGGLTFHMDCEMAKPSSGHTDPGPAFPRDVYLDLIQDAMLLHSGGVVNLNPYLHYVEILTGPIFRGSRGGQVRFVQWALGLPVDGVWGTLTETAVRALQHKHKRPVTGEVALGWTLEFLKSIHR